MTTPQCTTPNTLCANCQAIHAKLCSSRKFNATQLTTKPKTYPVILWKTMPGSTDLPNLYLSCRHAERMLATEARVNAVVWTSIFVRKDGAKTVKVLVDFSGVTTIGEDMRRRLFEGATENVGIELPELLSCGKLAKHASLARLEFFNESHDAAMEGRLLNPGHLPLSITV